MSAELELMRLEARVLASADVAGWLASVDAIRVLLESKPDDVRAAVLRMVAPKIERRALRAVLAAFALGRDDALAIVGALSDGQAAELVKRLPSKGATKPVRGLDAAGREAVATAVRLARSPSATAEELAAPLLGHANRVRGSVSDAVNRGGNEGSTAVADVAELATVWVAETDACVHCLAYSGVIAKPGEAFPGGLTYGRKSYYPDAIKTPPRHPRCLPFDAVVTPGSHVSGASARMYDGDFVRIKTLSGNQLTGTPNHPVLTRRGWVGLGLLEPSDEVVSRLGEQRVIRRGDDGEHMPALIGELAEATLGALEVVSREVPLAAVDFHGDGAGSEVGVVATDRMLQNELDAPLCEHRRELLLEVAAERRVALSSEGGSSELLLGLDASPDRVVSGGGPGGALLGTGIRHALLHRGGPVSSLDASLLEPPDDDGTADAEAIRDAELTLAGEVAFDQVVFVERYAFHGMVYNLETEHGWYIANGIVTHNCRCTVEPLVAREFADALRREADRSVLRGFSLESESMAVRVDAAERLLERGVDAPKSVIAFSRRAVRAGEFPTRGRPE